MKVGRDARYMILRPMNVYVFGVSRATVDIHPTYLVAVVGGEESSR
jgi:hypothetical protein